MQLWTKFFYVLIFQFMFFADGAGFGGGAGAGGDGGSGDGSGGSGEGDGGSGGAGDSGGGQGTGDIHIGEGGPVANLPSGVDDSVRNAVNSTLKNFFDNEGNINQANLLKSYVHNQTMLGGDKLNTPKDDWSADQWTEFNHKIGVPKEFTDYKVNNNLPEGMQANEEVFNQLLETAHKNGVRPAAMQAIADQFNQSLKASSDDESFKRNEAYEKGFNDLKQEWGEGYEGKLDQAMVGLKQFADEDTMKIFEEKGYFNDPLLTKIFQSVGHGLVQEDDNQFTPQGKRNAGISPDDAKLAIREHMQSPEARTTSRGHTQWQAQYNKLLNAAYGTKPASANQIMPKSVGV